MKKILKREIRMRVKIRIEIKIKKGKYRGGNKENRDKE